MASLLLQLTIRPEMRSDYDILDHLITDACKNVEYSHHNEAELVRKLRNSETHDNMLSLVAVQNQEIVGHILFSSATINTTELDNHPILVLAPLSVKPEFQNQGIGSLLVRRGLSISKALSYQYVVVVGNPNYYKKFGFFLSNEWNLKNNLNLPNEIVLIMELSRHDIIPMGGTIVFPKEFV